MEHYSLFDLQQKIKDSLQSSFPLPIWVVAEIGEIKVNYAGHCYLELIEKDDSDTVKIRAKVSANIWANKFRLLKAYFETSTRIALEQGLKVLVKVDVRFHEVYGLSLNVVDIDPSYTVGEMKLQRNLIIQKLMEEGIVDLNKEVPLPMAPQRIAVISSASAAGYQDFLNHLAANQFGYAFSVELFAAVMQGNEAEASIIAALDCIYSRLNDFDVAVIIRGGGSQTDLVCFDSYAVAANVAQFPIPVLAGIGHDKDESIVDIVAHQSFKTPTAVANFLIDCLAEFEDELVDYANGIGHVAQSLIHHQKLLTLDVEYELLNRIRDMLKQHGTFISDIAYTVSNRATSILNDQKRFADRVTHVFNASVLFSIKRRYDFLQQVNRELEFGLTVGLAKQKTIIDNLEARIGASSPREVLKRGYSLTLCDGQVVRQLEDLDGKEVETLLDAGRIKSKVTVVKRITGDIWQKRS
ncbi:exodeoxyribonuclease VII large subunit [uncultured Acetobacteroides sp.]|uniref:exodeoxyribonuclease VII large subunit n=1 Tax=uncultured Acetobacteroides sp. TaxID=1760811 RepID=UPI0029F558D0|nr:exodeoxyribonuclease VII large subunit [uncultured Acetobacteroides sp.]